MEAWSSVSREMEAAWSALSPLMPLLQMWAVGLALGLLLPRPKWLSGGRSAALLSFPGFRSLRNIALACHAALILRETWRAIAHPGTARGLLRATLQWACGNGWTFTWPAHGAVAAATAGGQAAACGQRMDSWYVGEKDLAFFRYHALEDGPCEGAGPWEPMMSRDVPGLVRYASWRRVLPSGKTEYKSVTISPGATAREFSDLYLDDDFRRNWDGMVYHHEVLEHGAFGQRQQVVRWLRRFPFAFLSDREYTIARREFVEPDGIYACTKAVDHPRQYSAGKVVRMQVFHSMWRSRDVPDPWGGPATACETVLLHHEDFRINENLARFAVKHGMWSFVKKLATTVPLYVEARRRRGVDPQAADGAAYGAGAAPNPPPAAAAPALHPSDSAFSLSSMASGVSAASSSGGGAACSECSDDSASRNGGHAGACRHAAGAGGRRRSQRRAVATVLVAGGLALALGARGGTSDLQAKAGRRGVVLHSAHHVHAIKEEVRLDGRSPYDVRPLKVTFALDDHSATVALGATTAMAAIAAELTAPYQDRSREGSVRFNVELSPMASAAFAAGRPGEGAVELARLVERCLRGSGALDLEALCVLPGRKVWSLRVDVHVLDAGGNLVDACCLAALAALLGFRKPEVEVDASAGEGEAQVIVHPPEVREPQPLTLHHLPLPHTYAIFEGGAILAADPCRAEEAAAAGCATLFVNPHGEVCGWQMAEGIGLDAAQMMRCVRLAAARAPELAAALQQALQAHELARVQARVRRHTGAAAAAAAAAGPGSLPGQGAAAGGGATRAAAAAAAAAAGAAAGVGAADPRNVTVLADAGMADERLEGLMAEIRDAVQRQQLRDEEAEAGAAAAAAAAKQARKQAAPAAEQAPPAGADPQQQRPGQQQQQQQQFVRPPALAGGARLAGATGGAKRPARDAGLDAFLGGGSGGGGGGGGGSGSGAARAVKHESLDAIEALLFQSAPQDLAAAVKPKRRAKKAKGGAQDLTAASPASTAAPAGSAPPVGVLRSVTTRRLPRGGRGMDQCCCAPDAGLGWVGELYDFSGKPFELGAQAAAVVRAGGAAAAAALLRTALALSARAWALFLAPALACASWMLSFLVSVLTSNAALVLFSAAALVAWQVWWPSRWTLRALARLPWCRGVVLELPPRGAAAPARKFVALTLTGGPRAGTTGAVLDLLAEQGCRATFFVSGAQVEAADARGAGDGVAEQGRALLRRVLADGHELGSLGWSAAAPSHALPPKQLVQEVADLQRVFSAARGAALAANGGADGSDQAPRGGAPRRRWFRPVGGLVTPPMVDALAAAGHTTVLGSVFPWDTVVSSPLANALYVLAKAYCGAVIVLHDRRRQLLPTLRYVLPWLRAWGYSVVTLSEAEAEAEAAAAGGEAALTCDALDAHDAAHGLAGCARGSAHSLAAAAAGGGAPGGGAPRVAGLTAANLAAAAAATAAGRAAGAGSEVAPGSSTPQAALSPAYAMMAKEHARAAAIAAAEEEERARIKAARRAEADRRAGIDRRLVDMSAADKRAIERREREKKEAERRRARRKVEEARAAERYAEAVRRKAADDAAHAEAEAEAAAKRAAELERHAKAAEALRRRQEAERAYAAELRARAPGEAGEPAGGEGSEPAGSVAGDAAKSRAPKLGKLMRKLSDRLSSGGGAKRGETCAGEAAGAAAGAAAAVAAAGAVAAATPTAGGDADASANRRAHVGEVQRPAAQQPGAPAYGWYGRPPPHGALAALAAVDGALAAQQAALAAATAAAAASSAPGASPAELAAAGVAAHNAALPAPPVGTYARGASGRVLLGFDGRPLLLTEAAPGQPPVLLDGDGAAVTGPRGEQLALLLGARGTPLTDPIGRPVLVALDARRGRPLGVHPDGSIILVPRPPPAPPAGPAQAATAPPRLSSGDGEGAAEAAAGASAPPPHGAEPSDESGSIKEAGSYAPSLARTSTSAGAGSTPPSGAGSVAAEPAGAPQSSPLAGCGGGDDDGVDDDEGGAVPAELLMGPHGMPLLGLDNRPLIVALDEAGAPLARARDGAPLLGPDGTPLQLAHASDGSLVALDSLCRPLTGPDGRPRVVALDACGRPLVDGETGRPVLLVLGPNGLPEAAAPSRRISWAGSASGARASHSGAPPGSLALAAGAGTGLEVPLVGEPGARGADGKLSLPIVDAADYGQYSAASLGVAAAAGQGERRPSFGHERALTQQRLLLLGEEEELAAPRPAGKADAHTAAALELTASAALE
ncbi:RRP45A [Scenedesmus sp. PABB004]|nr:RRP45A [Scenedesmus sp. PABB004]